MKKSCVLVFSFVGYEEQRLNINGQITLNVSLNEAKHSMKLLWSAMVLK